MVLQLPIIPSQGLIVLHCDRKKTGRWEVGALSLTKITKGRGSGKKALGSQRDVAFWDVTPEKEPS
jgi:hypothetical protein